MGMMRMFIAFLPDEQTLDCLVSIQNDMRKSGIRGRYTDPYNLHMTLVFIGEYKDPDRVMEILEEIPFEPYSMKLSCVMRFHDLYVCAFEENRELTAYVKRLHKAFSDHGIPFDRKNFFAHITLVRKAVNEYGLYDPLKLPELSFECGAVSLMHSAHGNHGMVYTEIDRIEYDETVDIPDQENIGGTMANTKEMGRIWNLSADTVTRLCRTGMIPSAEKEKGRWNIPSDAPKPPCTANMAVKLLKNIEMIHEGAAVAFSLYRKRTEDLVDSYEYLKAIGFLSDFRWKNTKDNAIDFIASLKDVKLTSAGREFIASLMSSDETGESGFDLSLGAKLGGGILPADVSADLKYSRKKKQ